MNFIRNRNFRAGPQTSLEGFICPQNSDKKQKIKVFGRSVGGKALFTCHDNLRVSYDLNEYENKQVNTVYKYSKNGIEYIKTDIRLEWPIVIQLLKTKPHALLVVFGHEGTMSRYAKRLNFLVKILKNKQIKLIK